MYVIRGGGSPIEKVYGEAMNERPPFLSLVDIGMTPLFRGNVRQTPTFLYTYRIDPQFFYIFKFWHSFLKEMSNVPLISGKIVEFDINIGHDNIE